PAEQAGKRIWYKVSTIDDCPNESASSTAGEAISAFNGSASIAPSSSPPPLFTGFTQTVTIAVVGADTFTSATLEITKIGGSVEAGFPQTQLSTGNNWNFVWTPGQGPGTYVATATVTNVTGCTSTAQSTWD